LTKLTLGVIYTPSNLSESGLFRLMEEGLKPEIVLAAETADIF